MYKRLLNIGDDTHKLLMQIIFYIGLIPIACVSWLQASSFYTLSRSFKEMTRIVNHTVQSTMVQVHNLPLAIIVGIIGFIAASILWRLICEVIYLILVLLKNLGDFLKKDEKVVSDKELLEEE